MDIECHNPDYDHETDHEILCECCTDYVDKFKALRAELASARADEHSASSRANRLAARCQGLEAALAAIAKHEPPRPTFGGIEEAYAGVRRMAVDGLNGGD